MALQHAPLYTVEQYLAIERDSLEKHEFLNGELFSMAGTSKEHNRIAFDTGMALHGQLLPQGCEAFSSDMRVRTAPVGLHTYSDLSIVCGGAIFDGETLTNPTAIVEVLSASTEAYDRGKKFGLYQGIQSLQLYILISQDKPQVEIYVRQPGGVWSYSLTKGLESVVVLHTIGCTLKLSEIYARVQFDQAETDAEVER